MAIKQMFLGIVLVVGLGSGLLASTPSPILDNTCTKLYETDYSPNNGWDTQVNVNTATGESTLTARWTGMPPLFHGTIEAVRITANDKTGSKSKDVVEHPAGTPDYR